MKRKKENKNKYKYKYLKRICLIASGLVFLITFGFLPDILFYLRAFFEKCPVSKSIICEEIVKEKYIELMLGPLLNCIAITVSIIALHTARTSGKIQVLRKNAKIITAASNTREIIKNNMMVLNSIRRNMGNIQELIIDQSAIEYAAYLYSAKEITLDNFIFFKEFTRRVSKINKLHELNNDQERDKKIEEFCGKYFKEGTVEYVEKLKNLVEHLDEIMKGESLCE